MKEYIIGILIAALAIGTVACNTTNNSVVPHNPASAQYTQIELLSRPAVKEAFESFTNHDTTNRTEPYNDATLHGEIGSFTTAGAGRSAATAAALQSILYPNEMVADLSSNASKGAYLGVETGGATGSTFGGRALSDDAIKISLGALFGNTLSALGVVPDDGKESPCLTDDHVPYASRTSASFPYTQAPL
jgi:hypothetical protein